MELFFSTLIYIFTVLVFAVTIAACLFVLSIFAIQLGNLTRTKGKDKGYHVSRGDIIAMSLFTCLLFASLTGAFTVVHYPLKDCIEQYQLISNPEKNIDNNEEVEREGD